MNKTVFLIVALAVTHASAFFFGKEVEITSCNLKLEKIHTQALEEFNKATIQNGERNNAISQSLINSQSVISTDIQNLFDQYNNAIHLSSFSAAGDSDNHRLHNDQNNSSGNTSMSDNSSVTKSVSACSCNNDERFRHSFNRLRERVLLVGRDCDITKTYYNNLLKYYTDLSNGK